jgi:hypothetical protein
MALTIAVTAAICARIQATRRGAGSVALPTSEPLALAQPTPLAALARRAAAVIAILLALAALLAAPTYFTLPAAIAPWVARSEGE